MPDTPMPDTPNPWAPLEAIKAALQEKLAPLGLDVNDWVLFPDAHAIQVVLLVDPKAFLEDEERKTLEQFEAMMTEQERFEREEKSRAKMQKMLGKFLDVPPEE